MVRFVCECYLWFKDISAINDNVSHLRVVLWCSHHPLIHSSTINIYRVVNTGLYTTLACVLCNLYWSTYIIIHLHTINEYFFLSRHDFENTSPSLLSDLYLVSATDTTKKACLSSSESSTENYHSCTNDTPLVLSKSDSDSTIEESLVRNSSKRSRLSGSESPTLNHSKRSCQSNSGSPFSSKHSHLSGLESPTLKREDSHNAPSESSTLFFIDTTPLNQVWILSQLVWVYYIHYY